MEAPSVGDAEAHEVKGKDRVLSSLHAIGKILNAKSKAQISYLQDWTGRNQNYCIVSYIPFFNNHLDISYPYTCISAQFSLATSSHQGSSRQILLTII